MTGNDKQTEEKIFEAATEVFITKGMDGARMQDIASLAGINKALLHYYYRTKDHLFNAVFEMIAKKMLKKFSPVFDPNLSIEDKIRFFFREHITFLYENPRLPAFILNEINRNPARIKALLSNVDINNVWKQFSDQHRQELKDYNITEADIPQLMTSIASLSVFPFAAKSIIEPVLEKAGVDFKTYIEERKQFAAEFVISYLRNHSASGTDSKVKTR